MEINNAKAIIEAILFACGREVKITEFMSALELGSKEVIEIIDAMKLDYKNENRGIEIIRVNDGFTLGTKKEYYEYIYPIFDKRSKPNLSNAALETLSIIAYNPKITRAEIESIRGVNSDGTIYKLLEYNLIESVGKSDAPGKPSIYCVTNEFLKMFGMSNLDELPELPRYKLDENQQIVIDDLIEVNNEEESIEASDKQLNKGLIGTSEEQMNKEPIETSNEQLDKELNEAPMPEREERKHPQSEA